MTTSSPALILVNLVSLVYIMYAQVIQPFPYGNEITLTLSIEVNG